MLKTDLTNNDDGSITGDGEERQRAIASTQVLKSRLLGANNRLPSGLLKLEMRSSKDIAGALQNLGEQCRTY